MNPVTKFIFFLFLLSNSNLQSQTCMESFYLREQASIDLLANKTGGCERIKGDVRIHEVIPGVVRNLEGFSHIKVIDGDLQIDLNEGLTSLSGLENIDSVYGSIIIDYNARLTDLSALDGIQFIGNRLFIQSNVLLMLPAFDQLAAANAIDLDLDSLEELNSFQQLHTVNTVNLVLPMVQEVNAFHEVQVCDSIRLELKSATLCNAFSSLVKAGYLSVFNCDSLESIASFGQLERVDFLNISSNNSLATLDNFASLRYITEHLHISFNAQIHSIDAMSDLDADSLKQISISENESLSNCATSFLCELAQKQDVLITIIDNGPGCDDFFDIAYACGLSCPEKFIFSNQDDIDQFPSRFPFCSEITGEVFIYGWSANPPIRNLDSLYVLEKIGSLRVERCEQLQDVTGLDHIKEIENDIVIRFCDSLLNLAGLDSIMSIDSLDCRYNSRMSLEGLSGLEQVNHLFVNRIASTGGLDNLKLVRGDMTISSISEVEFPPVLETIEGKLDLQGYFYATQFTNGFPQLKTTGGLEIGYTKITSLNGLDSLREIRGDLRLIENRHLKSLAGLEKLELITGDIMILNHDSLLDLSFLQKLDSTKGSLNINYNSKLPSLSDLSNLKSIGGNLSIIGNDALQDLNGVHEINVIEGNLEIAYQENFTTFTGFESLDIIRGSGIIHNNDHLVSISGFPELDTVQGNLNIYYTSGQVLDGFQDLAYIGGYLRIADNKFTTITGLNNLVYLGSLYLDNERELLDMAGLANLSEVGNHFSIKNCRKLTGIEFPDNIEHVTGNLIISGNRDLSHLSGLENLRVVDGTLRISDDDVTLEELKNLESVGSQLILTELSINSLELFESLQDIGFNSAEDTVLYIGGTNLSKCSIEPVCQLVRANPDKVFVSNNKYECNQHKFLTFNCLPDICQSAVIVLSRQSQVDSFNILYPGCHNVKQNLIINGLQGSDIVSLDSLYNIQQVGGSVMIRNLPLLKSLDGLHNITYIGGGILLESNSQLHDISALSNVDIHKLGVVQSGFEWFSARIYNNDSLSYCSYPFLCELILINSSVYISGNGNGCSSFQQIRSECSPTTICKLGLVQDDKDINDFPLLYPNCKTLESDLIIMGTVDYLYPLLQLEKINGQVHISSSNSLMSLNGLRNLEEINGPLTIAWNSGLVDIDEISKLAASTIQHGFEGYHLSIHDNERLSYCAVKPVCDLLTTPGAIVEIYDNNTGCDSNQEVITQCIVSAPSLEEKWEISIYPNPVSDEIHLSWDNSNITPGGVFLFDMFGRKLKSFESDLSSPFSFYTHDLSSGIYLLHVLGENGETSTAKLIKL